jgi:hypothetical protein
MKKSLFFILFIITILAFHNSYSQSKNLFAHKGTWEFGGSVGISSVTPISDGNTENAITNFSFMPLAGYFITEGFELALIPEIDYSSVSSYSATNFTIYLAPSYNFNTNSNAYPYVQGAIGYSSFSGTSLTTRSGFAWIITGGVKINALGNSLINLAVDYSQKTLNPSGWSGKRNGINTLEFVSGITIFL